MHTKATAIGGYLQPEAGGQVLDRGRALVHRSPSLRQRDRSSAVGVDHWRWPPPRRVGIVDIIAGESRRLITTSVGVLIRNDCWNYISGPVAAVRSESGVTTYHF